MAGFKQIVLGAIGDVFLADGRIASVIPITPHFHFVEVEAESLKKATWAPGDKVQINVGDWNIRTYTPIAIDPPKGRMRLLVHSHGNGPGSRWGQTVRPNDRHQFLGPRTSLALSKLQEPSLLFGDETSFAVASTLRTHLGANARFVFEVANARESRVALDALGLFDASVVESKSDRSHVLKRDLEIQDALKRREGSHLVLTGGARAIQEVRAFLRTQNFPLSQVLVKAYWAEGKIGID